jgi:hypothetical protein
MAASPNFPGAHSTAPPPAASDAEGFSIRLPSAQLGDLIQINCINRILGAFRLSSGPHEGYLFFADGKLIHAELGAATGLDAVVQMLGLRGGSIDPCVVPWPVESTIDMGADALLLHAAQRIDEQQPAHGRDDATTKVVRRVSLPGVDESRVPSGKQLSQLQVAQVTSDGTIQKLKSGATPDLADTAFFSHRMASALGEALGLGECRAVAMESKGEGIVVFKARSIVGTRGRASDLEFILRRVNLK